METKRFSLSLDWWAVVVAVAFVVLIKLNVLPHVSW